MENNENSGEDLAHRRTKIIDDPLLDTKVGERIELNNSSLTHLLHATGDENKSTSRIESGTTEDSSDINLDFLDGIEDSIYNRTFLDIKHDYRDALLCSLYTQVEFLKTELQEKNFLIRTLITRESEHPRGIYNESICRCKGNVNYDRDMLESGIGTISSSPTESLKKLAQSINSISSNEGNRHCDHVGEGLTFDSLRSTREGSLHGSVDSIRNSVENYTQPFMCGTRDVVDSKRHSEVSSSDSIDITHNTTDFTQELAVCASDSENNTDPLRDHTESTRNTRRPGYDCTRDSTRNSKKYACDSSPDSTHSLRDSSKSPRVSSYESTDSVKSPYSSSESSDSPKSPSISSCESTDYAESPSISLDEYTDSRKSSCESTESERNSSDSACNDDSRIARNAKTNTTAISTPFKGNTESYGSDTSINESKSSTQNITSGAANSIDKTRDPPETIVTTAENSCVTESSASDTSIKPDSIDETDDYPKATAAVVAAGESSFITVVRKKKEKQQRHQQKQQSEPTLIGNISYANSLKNPRKVAETPNKKQTKTQQELAYCNQPAKAKQANQTGKQPQVVKQNKKLNIKRKEPDIQNHNGHKNNEKQQSNTNGSNTNGRLRPAENARKEEIKKKSSPTKMESDNRRKVINIYPERDRVKHTPVDNSKPFSYSDIASKGIYRTRTG